MMGMVGCCARTGGETTPSANANRPVSSSFCIERFLPQRICGNVAREEHYGSTVAQAVEGDRVRAEDPVLFGAGEMRRQPMRPVPPRGVAFSERHDRPIAAEDQPLRAERFQKRLSIGAD